MPDGSIRAFSDATFGHIRGNTFRNGGACHWFDGIQQLIYDDNRCIGNSPMAGGSNVATYSGGYSHHLYLGDSSYEHVYGNDRETMTYDDAGSTYFGSLVRVSGSSAAASGPAVLETPGGNFSTVGGPKRNTEYNFGKAVIVANGTGAGQYRRVVLWRWSNNPNVPSRWVLDRPFDISPEPHAWVAIVTFRGENIFERNWYTDVGAFQFYGVGINNIASELIGTRMGGFITSGGPGENAFVPPGEPAGQISFLYQPNLFNQWLDITVEEGLRADHREGSLGFDKINPFGDPMQGLSEANAFSVVGQNPQGWRDVLDGRIHHNRYIVWRRKNITKTPCARTAAS